MACADRHGLYDRTSLNCLVLLGVDKIENINQGRTLAALRLAVGRFIIIPVVIFQNFIVVVFVVRLVYDAFFAITFSPAPPPPLLLCATVFVVFFLARILVEEKDGPVLVSYMGLIGKHQLGKHVLVPGNSDGVLVLHNRAAVNVEGGNQDVFDMVFCAAPRVLRAQLARGTGIGIVAPGATGGRE